MFNDIMHKLVIIFWLKSKFTIIANGIILCRITRG